MPDDVPHHEREGGLPEPEHVVPVASDVEPLAPGLVDGRDLSPFHRCRRAAQQACLKRVRDVSLALVAHRVVERVREPRRDLVRKRDRHPELGAFREAERQRPEEAPTDMERSDGAPSCRERPLGLPADEGGLTCLGYVPCELVEPAHPRVRVAHASGGQEPELAVVVEAVDADELETVAHEMRCCGVSAVLEPHDAIERRREPGEHLLPESRCLRLLVEQRAAEGDPDLRGERDENVAAVARQPALGRGRHRQRAADHAARFDGECAVRPPATVLQDTRKRGESLLELGRIANHGATQPDGFCDRSLDSERRHAVQRPRRSLDTEDRTQLQPVVLEREERAVVATPSAHDRDGHLGDVVDTDRTRELLGTLPERARLEACELRPARELRPLDRRAPLDLESREPSDDALALRDLGGERQDCCNDHGECELQVEHAVRGADIDRRPERVRLGRDAGGDERDKRTRHRHARGPDAERENDEHDDRDVDEREPASVEEDVRADDRNRRERGALGRPARGEAQPETEREDGPAHDEHRQPVTGPPLGREPQPAGAAEHVHERRRRDRRSHDGSGSDRRAEECGQMPLPAQVDASHEPEQERCSDERLGEVREDEPGRPADARPTTEVENHLGGRRGGEDEGPPAPAHQDERRERHARRREEGCALAGGAEPLPGEDISERIRGCDDDEERDVPGGTGLPRVEPRLPRRGCHAARSLLRRSERQPRGHDTPREAVGSTPQMARSPEERPGACVTPRARRPAWDTWEGRRRAR